MSHDQSHATGSWPDTLPELIAEGRRVIEGMKRSGYSDILWEKLLDRLPTAAEAALIETPPSAARCGEEAVGLVNPATGYGHATGANATTPPSSIAQGSAPESLRGEERQRYIHEHDCPKVWDFFRRYAMGSKLCPSCLMCGHQAFDRADWIITHGDLPDIYICRTCVDAKRLGASSIAHGSDEALHRSAVLAAVELEAKAWDAQGAVIAANAIRSLIPALKLMTPVSATQCIPVAEIEEQINHIQQNGLDLKRFGGENVDEGRCRELCAMYLREMLLTRSLTEKLNAMIAPHTTDRGAQ